MSMPSVEIQRIVAPLRTDLAPVYARGDVSTHSRRRFHVAARTTLDLDTYANAFFASHWAAHSSATAVRLRLTLSGTGRAVLRRHGGGTSAIVSEVGFSGRGVAVELQAPLAAADAPARLSVAIEGGAEGCALEAGSWWLDVAEVRPVGLVAGFCTYRREAFVLANLRALLDDREALRSLVRLVVVDQDRSEELARAVPAMTAGAELFRLVGQGNFGGSGGFCRVMLEALDEGAATHVLLMDDDAVLDPESLFRLSGFFAVAREGLAVGGQMLNLLRPTILHEGGARFSARRLRIKRVVSDLDIAGPGALTALEPVPALDYNAWFFFGLPLDLLRRVGVPLPFFINFDDVEFGLRLQGAGAGTVVLPGVGLWHMPGYAKDDSWKNYYYQRNILIIAAAHRVASASWTAFVFLRRALRNLRRGDRFRAALACAGARDYLAGPNALLAHPFGAQAEIDALRARFGASPGAPGQETAPLATPGLLARLGLWAKVLALAARLAIQGGGLAARYRAAFASLTAPAWWRRYLVDPAAAPRPEAE